MRERAATTSIIWIALAVSIDRILASVTDTSSGNWQVAAIAVTIVLIIAALGGTVAIWENAAGKSDEKARQAAEKAKRDDREARVRRLLATMDDEELDALESVDEEGERLSLEALLRKRN